MARADDGRTTELRSGKPRGGGEGPVLERSGRVVYEDPMVQAAAEEHQDLEIQDRWEDSGCGEGQSSDDGGWEGSEDEENEEESGDEDGEEEGEGRTYTQQDIDDLKHEWESENEALKQLRQIYPKGHTMREHGEA